MVENMEQDLISVIVPVYNIKEYITRCVQSISNQTYRNLEIILVDDGSDDGTGEICDRLAEKDNRIHVYHKKNGGSSSARNLGISKAKGTYIGFVDSDDYVDADMYQKLYEGIQKYGVEMAQIGRDEITPEGNLLPDICVPPDSPIRIEPEAFMKELLMHRGDCSFCTKLVHRSVLERCKVGKEGEEIPEYFPMGILNEDFHLLVRLLPKIDAVLSLPGHAYHVFYRVGSNSRKENKENFSRVYGDCVDNADMVSELVKNFYPDLVEIAFRFGVFQRLEYLLHIPVSQMKKENEPYRKIVKYMRQNLGRAMRNPYLTGKNKIYHLLFAWMPKGIRRVHEKKMQLMRKGSVF